MLTATNSMVLMIDIQEKLVKATNAETEAENARKMTEAANILGLPVLVSEQYPKGLGSTVSSISEKFSANTKIIEKSAFSLLKEENALETVKSYGKNQIILFGIETHICVLQTAIELIKNGFEVYLIKNASKSRQEFEHLAGIDTMKENGAKIVTLEIALFELLETSKHPQFKQIQALIK